MPMGNAVGWQDRDWAKWTDDERSRFLGHRSTGRSSSVAQGAFVGVVVSLVATVVLAGAPGIGFLRHNRASAFRPVYGTGKVVVAFGRDVTCTELLHGACGAYTFVQPGQRVLRAAPPPPGTTCQLLEVDQSRGAWVCGPSGPVVNS
jgi:hypothetical protein